MSNLILHNESLVFGAQSPFYKTISDAGVKERFLHLMADKNSKIILKRGFRTYIMANKIFPNSTTEINDYVKYGLGQIVNPFIGSTIKNSVESVMEVKRQRYSQGEVALTNELIKATKVKSLVAMVINSEKEPAINQKGITTYITRKFASCENNTLDAVWENKFFTFNDADSLCIIVAIPKMYIADVMTSEYAALTTTETTGTSIDNITFKANVVNKLTIDLIKSFFTAIYNDGYRIRINKDIASLNTLFKAEGEIVSTGGYDKNNSMADPFSEIGAFAKYTTTLKQFKSKDSENLVYEMLDFVRFKSYAIINPLDFYEGFIDIPYTQMQCVFDKIPAFNRLTNGDDRIIEYDFSNNLSGMNKFYVDEDRDIVIYAMKLVRYLPFLLFNTYVIGGGNEHSKMVQLLSNLKGITTSINSFKASSPIFSKVINFLSDELLYITDTLYKDFSSPVNVTTSARNVITSAILRYGATNDDVDVEETPEYNKDTEPLSIDTTDEASTDVDINTETDTTASEDNTDDAN